MHNAIYLHLKLDIIKPSGACSDGSHKKPRNLSFMIPRQQVKTQKLTNQNAKQTKEVTSSRIKSHDHLIFGKKKFTLKKRSIEKVFVFDIL